MRALDALELESDADFKAVKAAHRRLVKAHHPDANSGDAEAAKRFKQVQAAYDVLRRAEERKNSKPVSRTTRVRKNFDSASGLPACRLHNNFLAAPESCRSVQSQAATCCYRGLKMDRYRQYRSRLSRPSCHLTLVSTYSV